MPLPRSLASRWRSQHEHVMGLRPAGAVRRFVCAYARLVQGAGPMNANRQKEKPRGLCQASGAAE